MDENISDNGCPLCGSNSRNLVCPENDHRQYYHCTCCQLVTVGSQFYPSVAVEVARYREHNNGINQPGYVNFLKRIIDPALAFIEPGAVGLDYGCGPVPTLSELIARNGNTCYNYDPLFKFNHPLTSYDFIFATECLEHFHYPRKSLEKILGLIKDKGYLFLMTERWESLERFRKWYYKGDPTHVSFFHRDTFEYIKKKYDLQEMYSDRNRIIILKKK